jgi:integrase
MRYALTRVASELGFHERNLEEIPWHLVSALALQGLVRRWEAEMAASTLKLHVCAVRGLLRSCHAHGLITDEAYLLLCEIKTLAQPNQLGRGKYVEDWHRHKLMNSCDTDERHTLAARDKAMIAILFGAGIRRSEAISLEIHNLDLAGRSLSLLTKGGHLTQKPLALWSIQPLEDWLALLAAQGQTSGPVLRRVSNGGRALTDMKADGLYKALMARSLLADVPIVKPHDARKTVGTDLIKAKGVSFAKVALGQNSINPTLRYDLSNEKAIRAYLLSKKD